MDWHTLPILLIHDVLLNDSSDTLTLHTTYNQRISALNIGGKHFIMEACQMKLLSNIFQIQAVLTIIDCLRRNLAYSRLTCSKENKVSRRNHKLHVF